MMKKRKYCGWLVVVLLSCSTIYAQNINEKLLTDTDTVTAANNHLFTVGNVNITGNTKTKDFIMLREIPFKKEISILFRY